MKDEALLNGNSWTPIYESKPDIDQLVIVFRKKIKKYSIARMSQLRDEFEEYEYMWVTEYSNCHFIQDEDLWLKFEPVRTETLYN